MANSSDKKPSGNLAGIVMAIGTVAVPKVIDVIADKVQENPEGKERVTLPALYDKGFPLELNQAVELLTSYGLKAIPSKLPLKEAHIKYKDCFDMQVVDSKPKHKQKVKAGTTVLIRYITQDVIDESQKLFEEAERRKVEAKLEKAAERAKQKEQTKQLVIGAADKVKSGIGKITSRKEKGE